MDDIILSKDDGNFIRFGDYIALYSENDLGYASGNCSSELSNEPFVYSRQSYDLPENVSTMSMLLFEVCVVHRYKMDKRYRRLLQPTPSSQQDGPHKTDFATALDHTDTLKKAKEAAITEERDNCQVMRRNVGRNLKFGDVVQLRHVFSGYFLHINSNKLSQIQKSAFKTVLLPYSAKTAQFQLAPKYKVDIDGSEVVVGNYVSFESNASRSYFLHTNPNPDFPSSELQPGMSELNMSLEKHGFVLYKSTNNKQSAKTYLSGLDIIHFFHQESEAYLCAEGFFRGDVTEKVHMRVRKIDLLDVRTLTPSTNSNTYWELEKSHEPYSMDPVAWNELVRIKHGSTRLYLGLNHRNRLYLTSNIHDPRTVFKFHPVNKDREEFIRKGINVRVEHVISGSWLKVLPDVAFFKEEFSAHGGAVVDNTQVLWDDATLISVTMDNNQQYDDAFNLEEVGSSNREIFRKMCGFFPLVTSLQEKIRNPNCINDESLIRFYTLAVKEITRFVCINNKPNKNRQKLMRCTKMVDVLLSLLEHCTRASEVTGPARWRDPLEAVFELLVSGYLGDNTKQTEYAARPLLRMFSLQRPESAWLVAALVAALSRAVANSPRVADKLLPRPHIEAVLKLARCQTPAASRPVFLRFLARACSSRDVPIIENQDFMARSWLVEDKTGLYLIKDGSKLDQQPDQLFVSTDQGSNWISIQKFFQKSDPDYEPDACEFLLEQLEFFKALALGRNNKVIRIITQEQEYISLPMILNCLRNDGLPDEVRAKFCKLITTLFLTYGPNYSVLELPSMGYAYSEIERHSQSQRTMRPEQSQQTTSLMDEESSGALHDWILRFLIQNGSLCEQNVARNHLVVQVFDLLRNMVQYGYSGGPSTMLALVSPILAVLDGRNDVRFNPVTRAGLSPAEREQLRQYHYGGRYETQPSLSLVQAKTAGLELLHLLLSFQLSHRAQSLVKLFKTYRDRDATNIARKPTFESTLLKTEFSIIKARSFSHDSKSFDESMFNIMKSFDFFEVDRIKEVMLDLAQYKYEPLLHKSLFFLTKFFSSEQEVFDTCQDIMITSYPESNDWLDMAQQFVPRLEMLISSDWTGATVTSFSKMLRTVRAHCVLPNSATPNVVFQKILYSTSFVKILLNVFEKECGSKTSISGKNTIYRRISKIRCENYSKVQQMYGETLDCLCALAKDMPAVQNELFGRLDLLLSLGDGSSGPGLGRRGVQLLRAVLRDREDLAETVPAATIEWLFGWLVKGGHCISELGSDILELLQALGRIQPSRRLIRTNLELIVKLIMRHWSQLGPISDSSLEEKIEILTKVDCGPEKMAMLRIVYLMAIGAELGLEYVESFCQSVLSLDDCLGIIVGVDDFSVQSAFFKFISEVYVRADNNNKEHECAMTDITLSLKSGKFWRMVEMIQETNESWYQRIEQLSQQRLHDILICISDEEKYDSEECEYIGWLMDGVLPFMKELLAGRSATAATANTVSQDQLMIACSRLLIRTLSLLAPDLASLPQVELVTGCLFSAVLSNCERYISLEPVIARLALHLRSSLPISGSRAIDNDDNGGGGLFEISSDRLIQTQFLQQHRDEILLNQQFALFLANARALFVGENRASVQIIYPSPITGMAKIQSRNHSAVYTKIGTVEELPLGYEFQALVTAFLDLEEENPDKRISNLKCIMRHLKMQLPRKQGRLGSGRSRVTADQDRVNMACFRVMRSVLHNEIVRLPADWPQHMTDPDVARQLQFIRRLQTSLCDIDLFESILHHASRVSSPVTMELFAFLKVLLFNASTYIQENIYQFFIVSVTETFFFAIKEFLAIFEKDIKNLRRRTNTQLKGEAKEKNQFRVRRDTLTNMDLSVYFECKEFFYNERLANKNNLGNFRSMRFESTINNGFGILLMEVLQSLCEGQFVKLQDYMRVQADNPKSFNLVARTCSMIGGVYAHISGTTIGILTQVFAAINQMTIGNHENRVTLVNGKVIDYVNFILRVTEFNGASPDQVLDLKETIATLLVNLTEENSPYAQQLAKEILITADKRAILNIILQYYKMSKKDALPDLAQLTSPTTPPKPYGHGCLAVLSHLLCDFPAMRAARVRQLAPVKERIFQVGYLFCALLLRLQDLQPNLLESLPEEDFTAQHRTAFRGFRRAGRSIEIIKDNCLQRLHFRVRDPKVIREDLIESIKWDVDRTSSASKLRDFLNWSESVIADLETAKKTNPIKAFLIQSWYLWNYLPVIISLVINIMMLITFESQHSLTDGDYKDDIHNPFPHLTKTPRLSTHMVYFATVHSVLSIVLLATYLLIAKPGLANVRSLYSSLRSVFCRCLPPAPGNSAGPAAVAAANGGPSSSVRLRRAARRKIETMTEDDKAGGTFIDYQKLKQFIEEQTDVSKTATKSRSGVAEHSRSPFFSGLGATSGGGSDSSGPGKNKLQTHLFGLRTGYYVLFLLCSLCGTVIGAYASQMLKDDRYMVAYYLFAFHMINIALVVTDLKGVFQAVKKSLPSMAWVGLLILVIIFAFNIVLFVFFRDALAMENNLYCDTLGHCYVTLLRFGFIFDKWMELFVPTFDSRKNFQNYLLMAVFTVLLFIVVAIIMLNICAGIIVDKFASTRNLKDSKHEDMNNFCFICGRSSYEFETVAKGFRYHITREHNMWAYLYFLISLQTKTSDFTALQLHVYNMFHKKNLDFFPIDRALALTQALEVTEEERLNEANGVLNMIIDDMQNVKMQKEQLGRKRCQDRWRKEALQVTSGRHRPNRDSKEKNRQLATSLPTAAQPPPPPPQPHPQQSQYRSSVSQLPHDPRDYDQAVLDFSIPDVNVQFCPSTNINSIPINLISFDPANTSFHGGHDDDSDEEEQY